MKHILTLLLFLLAVIVLKIFSFQVGEYQALFEIFFWIVGGAFLLLTIASIWDVFSAARTFKKTKNEYISLKDFLCIVMTFPGKFDEIISRLDPITKALLIQEDFDVTKCKTFERKGVEKIFNSISNKYEVFPENDDYQVWSFGPHVLGILFEVVPYNYPLSEKQLKDIDIKSKDVEIRKIGFSSKKLLLFYNNQRYPDISMDKYRKLVITMISSIENILRP